MYHSTHSDDYFVVLILRGEKVKMVGGLASQVRVRSSKVKMVLNVN